jgi:acyl-CoA-binding protein
MPAGTPMDEEDAVRDAARARARMKTATMRGAAIGAALRGGLRLGKYALKTTRGGRKATPASMERVIRATEDVVRYAGFLAAFAGTYVVVDEGLRKKFGAESSARWRCALAGACAGPSLLLTGSDARHYGLAGYIWVRSIVLLTRVAQKSEDERVKRVTRVTKYEHGDVALMVGSAAVILSAFIMKPDMVEPAYKHFLDVHGGKSLEEYGALRALCEAKGDDEARALCSKLATSSSWSATDSARDVANRTLASELAVGSGGAVDKLALYRLIFFKNASNPEHFLKHVAKSFSSTFSVYLPVYLVPALMIHREKLFSSKKGPDLLGRIAIGSARSALFLSSYVGAAWSGVDVANRIFGRCDERSLAVGVSMAGLATFVEKKSRRMELAMYCASRALETAALMAVYRGLVPGWVQRQRGDVFLFSLASATIMHCYNAERDVFRSKYLNVLDYIFGSDGHDSQSISHVASYEILFARENPIEGGKRVVNRGGGGRRPAQTGSDDDEVELQTIDTSDDDRRDVTQEEFIQASHAMKDSLSHASVDEILTLYGLYKQATVGDSTLAKRPGILDSKGRAKYAAWEHFLGTKPQLAMNAYVRMVRELCAAAEFATPALSPDSQRSTTGE